MGSVGGLSPCCPVSEGRGGAPLGPTPGSSVVLLPRSVDVVEQRDGEGHAQELRKEEEGYGEAADADMRPPTPPARSRFRRANTHEPAPQTAFKRERFNLCDGEALR